MRVLPSPTLCRSQVRCGRRVVASPLCRRMIALAAHSSAAHRGKTLAAGLLDCVLAAMSSHTHDANIQRFGCEVLRHCAHEAALMDAIRVRGSLLATAALEHHVGVHEVVTSACRALSAIGGSSPLSVSGVKSFNLQLAQVLDRVHALAVAHAEYVELSQLESEWLPLVAASVVPLALDSDDVDTVPDLKLDVTLVDAK